MRAACDGTNWGHRVKYAVRTNVRVAHFVTSEDTQVMYLRTKKNVFIVCARSNLIS